MERKATQSGQSANSDVQKRQGLVNAEANLLNSKTVDQIGVKSKGQLFADNDGPIPYGYVDDRDVLWSKVVSVFYTHFRAHETGRNLVCRLLF